ncbi:hypothetical protein EmuJ_000783800 [Echinococcus multilocularis]|uniref:Uncharacterized protein n=1 Tax=Echinococcus multilocularis TaxID=6211 RepID=A0A068YDG9_ECHMU|nr:hypothetical protein EmuJ_000783800 [Echinococcus multilocularis]
MPTTLTQQMVWRVHPLDNCRPPPSHTTYTYEPLFNICWWRCLLHVVSELRRLSDASCPSSFDLYVPNLPTPIFPHHHNLFVPARGRMPFAYFLPPKVG